MQKSTLFHTPPVFLSRIWDRRILRSGSALACKYPDTDLSCHRLNFSSSAGDGTCKLKTARSTAPPNHTRHTSQYLLTSLVGEIQHQNSLRLLYTNFIHPYTVQFPDLSSFPSHAAITHVMHILLPMSTITIHDKHQSTTTTVLQLSGFCPGLPG